MHNGAARGRRPTEGLRAEARDMVLNSAQYVIAQQAIRTVALETRKYV